MLHIAKALADQGRNGDTHLLHVSSNELQSLDQAAKARGLAGLPHNPRTGLPEASFMSDIGINPNGINGANTLGTIAGIGSNVAAIAELGANPVMDAAAANYDANQVSRVTGGTGSGLQDAGMSKAGANDVGIGLQIAGIYNMTSPMTGQTPIGGGNAWGSPTASTPTGSGANLDPSLAYNAGTPAANITPPPAIGMPTGPDGAMDLSGAPGSSFDGAANGLATPGSGGGGFQLPTNPAINAQLDSGISPSAIANAAIDNPASVLSKSDLAQAARADAASGSTPWTKSDYLLAASLAGPAYGMIDSATNGKKNQGPTQHTSTILTSNGHRDANGNMVGLYGPSSNYGTKQVTSTYSDGGGIRGLASGGRTSVNVAGTGSTDPNRSSVNMSTIPGAPATDATAPALDTYATTYDPATMPAGAKGLSGYGLQVYLAGLAALQPQVDATNNAIAQSAAEKASNKNGQNGIMDQWGNAIANWWGGNNSQGLVGGIGTSIGQGVQDLGKSLGLAQGGSVSGGISSLPPHYLHGPGDAMSDSIPAYIDGQGQKPHEPIRVADGEYVVPGDAVSHLGNGSSNAGAKRLDKMVKGIRAARTGTTKQAPQVNANKFLPA